MMLYQPGSALFMTTPTHWCRYWQSFITLILHFHFSTHNRLVLMILYQSDTVNKNTHIRYCCCHPTSIILHYNNWLSWKIKIMPTLHPWLWNWARWNFCFPFETLTVHFSPVALAFGYSSGRLIITFISLTAFYWMWQCFTYSANENALPTGLSSWLLMNTHCRRRLLTHECMIIIQIVYVVIMFLYNILINKWTFPCQ